MRRGHACVGALCAAALLAVPTRAAGQQSFFNVPSTTRTHDRALFGQVQFNLAEHAGEVNTTLELGLVGRFEVGMNFLHLDVYRCDADGETDRDVVLANGSVLFEPTSNTRIQLGAAVGAGRSAYTRAEDPAAYGWATFRWEGPGYFGTWVIGMNAGTRAVTGRGFPMAGLLAVELPILDDRLSFQADWVIGTNEQSVAVVGLVAELSRDFQLASGVQLPSPGSGNSLGAVVELTWLPQFPGVHPHPAVVPR